MTDKAFEVEKIVKREARKGKEWFLIKWKGYSSRYNTWEPKMNVLYEISPPKKRKTSSRQNSNQQKQADTFIKKGEDPSGFEVRFINEKIGKGVFTTKTFQKGDFLLEYDGELITAAQAKSREDWIYSMKTPLVRSYIFEVNHNGQKLCIDATHSKRLCRFVNDAPQKESNCVMKKKVINNRPHLILVALKDIPLGAELRYDYNWDFLPWRSEEKQPETKETVKMDKADEEKQKDQEKLNGDILPVGSSVDNQPDEIVANEVPTLSLAVEVSPLNYDGFVASRASEPVSKQITQQDMDMEEPNKQQDLEKGNQQKLNGDILPVGSSVDNQPDEIVANEVPTLSLAVEVSPLNYDGFVASRASEPVSKQITQQDMDMEEPNKQQDLEKGNQQKLNGDILPVGSSVDIQPDEIVANEVPTLSLAVEVPTLNYDGFVASRASEPVSKQITQQDMDMEEPNKQQDLEKGNQQKLNGDILPQQDMEIEEPNKQQDLEKGNQQKLNGDILPVGSSVDNQPDETIGNEVPTLSLAVEVPTLNYDESVAPRASEPVSKQITQQDMEIEEPNKQQDLEKGNQQETVKAIPGRLRRVNQSIVSYAHASSDDKWMEGYDSSDAEDPSYKPDEDIILDSGSDSSDEESVPMPKKRCLNGAETSRPSEIKGVQQKAAADSSVPMPKKRCLNGAETSGPSEIKVVQQKAAADSTTDTKSTDDTYKKPYRLCPFCNTAKSKLSLHIQLQHKDEERVKAALALPKRERDAAFNNMKKEGILQLNKREMMKDEPNYMREKSSSNEKSGALVMCSKCNGFYSRTYIKRHTNLCLKESEECSRAAKPIPINLFSSYSNQPEDFTQNVLVRFRNDEIGKMCNSDQVLMEIGSKLWGKQKRKIDKQCEVRKSVMTDMRRLGTLYSEMIRSQYQLGTLKVKSRNVSDVFQRNNFRHLEEAIEACTRKDGDGLKAGLKLQLYYLLLSTSKIMKVIHLMNDDDDASDEVDKFIVILQVNQSILFGDAQYQVDVARERKLKRPSERPLETDMKQVRDYIVQRTKEIVKDEFEFMDKHRYAELRDLTVCRLTLFNARRGGEPARLTLDQWSDAANNSWLDQQVIERLDPLDAAIAKDLKITYQTGKGRTLVPFMFPRDTVTALEMLSNEETRSSCSVDPSNKFLFASTTSLTHVAGWYAVDMVCKKLDLQSQSTITATRNRHRISTEFALLDVPQQERQYIYRHLGHSEDVNRDVYQDPLAITTLKVVGRRLLQLDDKCPVDAEDAPSSVPSAVSDAENELVDAEDAPSSIPPAVSDAEHVLVDGASDNFKLKGRKYTKWEREEEKMLTDGFKEYIEGRTAKRYPGREEVREFLESHPNWKHDVRTTFTKIMNEVNKRRNRAKGRKKTMMADNL